MGGTCQFIEKLLRLASSVRLKSPCWAACSIGSRSISNLSSDAKRSHPGSLPTTRLGLRTRKSSPRLPNYPWAARGRNPIRLLKVSSKSDSLPSFCEGGDEQLFWVNDGRGRRSSHTFRRTRPARRVDDRRVISGILHVLKTGCRWKDCPAEYAPSTTIYNRWSRRQLWSRILDALVAKGVLALSASIDSSCVKAHRSGMAERGRRRRASGPRAAAKPPRSMAGCDPAS